MKDLEIKGRTCCVLVLAPGRAPSTQDSARWPLVSQTIAFFVLIPLGFLFLLDNEVSSSPLSHLLPPTSALL